jgi:cysteine synthase
MAEQKGLLIPHSGDTIYEGTVGSTGISLAAICRARGYKAHMQVSNNHQLPNLNIVQMHAQRYGGGEV